MGALVPTEAQEQAWLAAWLDAAGLLWCHVPNGGRRHVVTARALKAHGVKSGVPDVLIFTPPPRGRHMGCAIELKRVRGGTTSAEQKAWLKGLAARHWATTVARGAQDAIDWLTGPALGYRCGR